MDMHGDIETGDGLTIGQVARQASVNVETLRYYERRGLIPAPPRRASGYRQYPARTVARIRFIKRAQELGFSLREISGLLALRVDPGTTCADVRTRAEAKIAEIEEKIRDLRRMRMALERLASACRGKGPTSDCPILEELEKG
jgi:MerR family mercuric resistance operon transcriptional regulator